MKKTVCFITVFTVFFLSCQSLQRDRLIDNPEGQWTDTADLEQMIVALDREPSREGMTGARNRIETLEKRALPDTGFNGVLAAWSGRLYLLEGKNGEAQRQLKLSQSLSPGNMPSLVLAIRLEGDPQKRLNMIDRELAADTLSAELQIERGRTLMEMRRFAEAAAAFDTAFTLSQTPVYRDTYRQDRERAWELRNTDTAAGTRAAAIMDQEGLNWADVIELARSETDLLRFITAGRDWSGAEIFPRLLERSFIPYTQNVNEKEWPHTKPRLEDKMFRSGAAYFLWHLYAENRADRGLLTRYSARYAAQQNPRSPISDLPLLSPFFDSIVGCVESEFMALPDGRNFIPSVPVKPAEFLAMLKKLN